LTGVDTAPSFSMTFNNKYLNGTYTIIDLSWYAPYKEFGDDVICMFFYLGFIWHLFSHMASFINGADSGFNTIGTVSQDGEFKPRT